MTLDALLVTGNDDYLRSTHITAHTRHIHATHPGIETRRIDADGLTADHLDELLGPTLFGTQTLVHITTGAKLAPATLAVLVRYATTGTFLVEIPKPADAGGKAVITALTKAGVPHEAVTPPKTPADLRRHATAELRTARLRTDSDVAGVLADGEHDLRGIITRIQQLDDDHAPGTTITAEDAASITTTTTASGFAVADALAARNPRALTAATRAALDAGAAPLMIQASCLITLRDLSRLTSGQAAKMPPWKAKKLRPLTRAWTPQSLATAIHEMGVIGETVRSTHATDNAFTAALLRAIA